MSRVDELLVAVVAALGERIVPMDDLRSTLVEGGAPLGEPDRFGHDELDQLVHVTPDIALFGDGVAHLPSLYRGVSWSVPITADDARHGYVTAAPFLSPLVDMMLDGDVDVVGADGESFGPAAIGAEIVVLPTDALAGPATFTVVADRTVQVAPLDAMPGPDPTMVNAVDAAFAAHATTRSIGVEVTTSTVAEVLAAAVAADRSAFTASTVAPLDALITAAGLTVRRGLVGASDTDWEALENWLAINRIKLDHEIDDDQARKLLALTDDAPDDSLPEALDDAVVAEIAWWGWTTDGIDPSEIADRVESSDSPGATWLRARIAAVEGRADEAVELLDGVRASGHAMVLADLAALAADRSDPLAARALLNEAGVSTDIDLDDEYDPVTSTGGFGRELAEEIAPFAAMRPRPMAGRNDPCPCGSGRKYKQCHLGNELHAVELRAGWLYVKMMRFMQLVDPSAPMNVADAIVSEVESDDLQRMLRESYLPIDLAFHEGQVADMFLDAKRSLLPADEVALVESWIAASRSVYEVTASTVDDMQVVDLATRERLTVRDTVPEEPLEAGWKVIGRLVPVGDSHRAYSGFLPVNDDMVDIMLAGFDTRDLETVALTIGQIFQTAELQDLGVS